MRRRGLRGPVWPDALMSFDAADWPGAPDAGDIEAAGYVPGAPVTERVAEAVAVRRWSAAREAFAEAHGLEYVVTMIGGRRFRRLAFLEAVVNDPRERQHAWDRPA